MPEQNAGLNVADAVRILKKTTGTSRLLKSFLIFQTLAVLDLLGVLIFGYIGGIILNGIDSNLSIIEFDFLPGFLNVDKMSLQVRVTILTGFAIAILLFRSICSLYFTRRNLQFLGRKSAETSGRLVRSILNGESKRFQNISTELYTVTTGVQQLYTSVVGNLLGAMADLLLSLTFIIGILFVDVFTSLVVAILFSLFGWILHSLLAKRVKANGEAIGRISRQSQQEVMDTVQLFREIRLRGVSEQHSNRIKQTRRSLFNFLVPNQIYGILNKYLIEGFLLLTLTTVAGFLFLLYDVSTGFAKLAIFFIASSRIAPALLRLQQSLFQANSHIAQAHITLNEMAKLQPSASVSSSLSSSHEEYGHEFMTPRIEVDNVSYTHMSEVVEMHDWKLEVKKLVINPGDVVAILGPSGSGKTTFVDLLLGFKEPNTGSISIDGIPVHEVSISTRGYLGYVPQEVHLQNSSIIENISLLDESILDDEDKVWEVMDLVGLGAWAKQLPQGLETIIGSGSIMPSGGQRQRIGLARCLISKPRIIVLDEVTSGLDASTEKSLLKRMASLPWVNTQIWVTHRQAVADLANIEVEVGKNGKISIRKSKVND